MAAANAGNIVNELTLPELYAELSKTGVYSLASCSPCICTQLFTGSLA